MSDTNIHISNLTLSYGKNVFIRDLSVDLEGPSLVKVYGNNGAGKTSLLRYIVGIFEGSVNEEKKRIQAEEGIKLLDNTPSLIENELLNKVGMNKFNKDVVANLSSGMKKRIETAILIWKKPSIVCLDEPENFLDQDGVKIVKHIIQETIKAGGIVIYSSLQKEPGNLHYDVRIDLK